MVDEEPAPEGASPINEELRAELLARREEDQRIRKAVTGSGGRLTREQQAEWERIDEANTLWLKVHRGRRALRAVSHRGRGAR
jgi:hypothetical protein